MPVRAGTRHHSSVGVVAELLGVGVAHRLEPAELRLGPAPNVFEPLSHHARCHGRVGEEAGRGDEARTRDEGAVALELGAHERGDDGVERPAVGLGAAREGAGERPRELALEDVAPAVDHGEDGIDRGGDAPRDVLGG